MKKIEFRRKWKKFIMCFAVVMAMFAAPKAATVYAGDFTTAVTLPTNGVWSGKCELAKGATDYYKFTISKAGEVDIKLMSYTHGIRCTLYDSNFDEVSYVNSYGSESSPATRAITEWLSQGTYYVSVSLSEYRESGNYKLYASFSSSGINAADKDSYDSPQNMRINSKVTGVLTNSNNVDWYKVTVSSTGKYRYIFQCSDSMRCSLYDMNLSELSYLFRYYAYMETKEVELKPGTYYIKIQGYVSSTCGTYTCQFNEAIPAKGDILTDSNNQAQYKVTKSLKSGGTVTYLKPMNGVKTSITVPAMVRIDGITYKVTGIAKNAFKGNGMLKKVTIGKNITSIGKNSFSGCSKLKKLTIGKNVVSIGDNAFLNCTSLKTVTIPAKVKKIGKQAFCGCKKLKTIKVSTKKLVSKNVGSKAFAKIDPRATVKVPASCLKSYKKLFQKKGINGKRQKIKK